MANEFRVLPEKDKNVLDSKNKSFEERKQELKDIAESERRKRKQETNSPFNNFIQVNNNKEAYKQLDKLMQKNPLAYRVWWFLVYNMDNYNAVMVSYNVLIDVFEVSRTTLYRVIKLLEDDGYIKIYKSGTSNVYALNDDLVWNSWGRNKQYSKFRANVIISDSEQTDKVQEEIKLKKERITQVNKKE